MRSLVLLLAIITACVCIECSSPPPSELLIFFKVTGLVPAIKSLGVTLRVDGKLAKEGDFIISDNLSEFAVRLPTNSAGKLTVAVGGRDGLGNVIFGSDNAASANTIQPGATSITIEIPLLNLYPCTKDGWCPYNPIITASGLNAVWGADRADVWAGGYDGTLLHWNGQYWTHSVVPPTSKEEIFLDIWGSSSSDVYAVGVGPMIHWDGNNWATDTSSITMGLRAIGGSSSQDIWAVPGDATVLHSNGSSWTVASSDSARNRTIIWSSGANDIWLGGGLGSTPLIHCTATNCASVNLSSPGLSMITGIWGSSSNDIWLDSNVGLIHLTPPSLVSAPYHVVGQGLHSLSGSSGDDIWAVGGNSDGSGAAAHWDGLSWTDVSPVKIARLSDVWATGPGSATGSSTSSDVWAVGDSSVIAHWYDNHWIQSPSNNITTQALVNAWGTNAEDIWAVGENGTLVHWDGINWKLAPSSIQDIITDIIGIDANHYWAVGANGLILTWNGSSWTNIRINSFYLTSVFALDPTNIWAVGYGGAIIHYNGTNWAPQVTTFMQNLTGIWASDPSNVWAVGQTGTLLYYDGTSWTDLTTKSGTTNNLVGIWGSRPGDFWIAQSSGPPLHCNNVKTNTCSATSSSASMTNIVNIYGINANDIWSISSDGTAWHYTGTTWSPQTASSVGIWGIWGNNSKDIWAVGAGGTIIRKQG